VEPTIKIGKTIKSFGKDGFIRIIIEDPYKEDVSSSRYLLIEQEGFCIPYFIDEIDMDAGLVKFDELNGPEETKRLSDSPIFLLERDIKTEAQKPIHTLRIEGFILMDQNQDEIGEILEIIEMPMQELLLVLHKGQEIMIPFHEDLLLGFDKEEKIIQLEITAGLLDL
jgi:16S rRNA processing protein RimM